jgi:hypothetical protein
LAVDDRHQLDDPDSALLVFAEADLDSGGSAEAVADNALLAGNYAR